MAVNINVPSQVKTYANLAAFPATGALKTIYIAEDTNKTYRWTGSVYTEISASAAMTWGQIGGTLSNQTDLQNALDAKVPTSRTLTINGVTQDLSANRTFTISTGITIGSTAITSGTVGRVLFQGTGNVVSQSSNLFWDATNNRLGIGTSSPTNALTLGAAVAASLQSSAATIFTSNENASNVFSQVAASNEPLQRPVFAGLKSRGTLLSPTAVVAGDAITTFLSSAFDGTAGQASAALSFDAESNATSGNAPQLISFITGTSGATRTTKMQVRSNGNVLIGTTTDSGFRLDVNGTARVSDNLLLTNGIIATSGATTRLQSSLNYFTHNRIASSGVFGFQISSYGTAASFWRFADSTYDTEIGNPGGALSGGLRLFTAGTERMQITIGGLVLVGTTTAVSSSQFTIESTTRGFLPPRMTTTQKNAIASPAAGLMVYDTTLNVISYYNGTMWI